METQVETKLPVAKVSRIVIETAVEAEGTALCPHCGWEDNFIYFNVGVRGVEFESKKVENQCPKCGESYIADGTDAEII